MEFGPIDLLDADKDEEKWWFDVSLKDLGCKPFRVNEG